MKIQKLTFYLAFIMSVFLFSEWRIKEASALNQSQIFKQILPQHSQGGLVAKPISSESLSKIKDQINRGHLDVNAIFEQQNMDGTLLSWAALGCQLEFVRFLLSEENLKLDQLDVSWNNKHGNNMLHFVSVSLGFKGCNQLLQGQSQCHLPSDLISISNDWESSGEDEVEKDTNHQEPDQAVKDIEPNPSSQNGERDEKVVIAFRNMTRSSEILCLLLNAKWKEIKTVDSPARKEAFKNWVNQQERILGKTPGHVASEYVGAHLSSRIGRRGGRVETEEINESLSLSKSFFLLLHIMGADFYGIQAQMQVGGHSFTRLMSVDEKLKDVSKMFATYEQLRTQVEMLAQSDTTSNRQALTTRMRMSLVPHYGGGSLSNPLGGQLAFQQMDLGFRCSTSGCSFTMMTYQPLEGTGRPSIVFPFDYAVTGIREGLEKGWWEEGGDLFDILEKLDDSGSVKPPPIKCSARGQGGGPFVALGYTCQEAKKFAIWRCRFPSRYHPSSCYITACIGTDPDHPIICDTTFEYGK